MAVVETRARPMHSERASPFSCSVVTHGQFAQPLAARRARRVIAAGHARCALGHTLI